MANSVVHRRCYIVLFNGKKRVKDQVDIREAQRAAYKHGLDGDNIKIYYDQCYDDNILVKEFHIAKTASE